MKRNNLFDTVVAYRLGNHYTFELPPTLDQEVGLVSVRLLGGAWLERTPAGETVVCTQDYRFGARLMAAVALDLCTVEPFPLEELMRQVSSRRSGFRVQGPTRSP